MRAPHAVCSRRGRSLPPGEGPEPPPTPTETGHLPDSEPCLPQSDNTPCTRAQGPAGPRQILKQEQWAPLSFLGEGCGVLDAGTARGESRPVLEQDPVLMHWQILGQGLGH